MNPKVPDVLGRVLNLAHVTLDHPTGDLRRLDQIEKLFDEVHHASTWPSEGPSLVNDWTLMLMKMLRKIERLGPLGDTDELARATTVGLALMPYVSADVLKAHAIAARPSTTDHDFKRRARWPS
jgi:hypothetical protein